MLTGFFYEFESDCVSLSHLKKAGLNYILNIETSTKNCSVSISSGDEILAIKELNEGQFSHAEKLHPFIDEVLRLAEIAYSDLAAISVSKGPGSYTGLRIGVSAAKGLCYALDVPLIAAETLQLLARSVEPDDDALIVPMIDARRMEVYAAVYDKNYNQVREIRAEIIDEQSFSEELNRGKVYFLGDGAAKCKPLIQHPNAVFLDGIFPSASKMAAISDTKFRNKDFEDVAYFEPFYLKDFIAGVPKKFFNLNPK